jgi:hypothetical protein
MKGIKERAAVLGGTLSALLVGAFVMAGAASATPTDPIETGFADMGVKLALYSGLLVGLVVIAVGVTYGIGWIKKVRSAK